MMKEVEDMEEWEMMKEVRMIYIYSYFSISLFLKCNFNENISNFVNLFLKCSFNENL